MHRYSCVFLVLACAPGLRAESPARVQYRIETVAGSAPVGDGGLAINAQLGAIQGVAVDRQGVVYLSDTDHNRVRRIGLDGVITTVAGTGDAGFSGDGGPGFQARLNLPYGLAVDRAGNLYIADLGNNRIRRVDAAGTIATVVGNGIYGNSADGVPAADARLLTPRNVAVNAVGELYFSEFEGHRVRKAGPDGLIATVAGTGWPGTDGTTDRAVRSPLSFPAGLTFDQAGALYIADSSNNRIQKVTPDGAVSTCVGEGGTLISQPLAVAVDLAGTIYVVDISPDVRALQTSGRWFDFAGGNVSGFSGDGRLAASARLASPRDVVAANGKVYIADGVRVRMVDEKGVIHTIAGDGFLNAVGDSGPAADAILVRPTATSFDSFGNLYIADTDGQRIRQVTPAGMIGTLAGTGVAGYGPEPGPASSTQLKAPAGIAATPAGAVWIADTNNQRVRLVDANGLVQSVVGTGHPGSAPEDSPAGSAELRAPSGVCLDPSGAVYIVDSGNNRILRLSEGRVSTAAGSGAPGYSGDGGDAKRAGLNQPRACAVDWRGNLFIADTENNRIRKVDVSGVIATLAGSGEKGGFGDEGPAAAAALSGPYGVAADGDGNVYIADTGNHRIREVTTDGVIHTIAGQYGAGWSGDGDLAVKALLNAPSGLALDGAGILYFADAGNGRVRRLVPLAEQGPQTGGVSALTATNAASLLQGPVAPGELVSLFGEGLGPASGAAGAFDAAGSLPLALAGVEVRFDGEPAPVLYAQAKQVNVQTPYRVFGRSSTHAQVFYLGALAGVADLAVADAAPAFFAVATNQDGTLNTASAPVARGEIVVLYATGEGLTDGANLTGKAATFPYAKPKLPVRVTVGGGALAEILYAGCAPGWAGLMQVNARLPGGLATGAQPVKLTIGGAASPEITVWVK
jgi:uncharacterized protein (TIGR03437 family)